MKTIKLITLLVLGLLASCSPEKENMVTSLKGEVINPKGDNISLRLQDTTITAALDSVGNFQTNIPINKAEKVVFAHGNEITTLYLRPGDQLSLTIDPREFDESIKYEGKGAAINNFLASTVLMEDTLKGIAQLAALSEDSFLVAFRKNYVLKENALEKSGVKDQEFKDWYLKNNDWEFYFNLLNYSGYKSRLTKEEFEPSENFYAFQDSLDLYDSSNLDYEFFIPYLQRQITFKVGEKFKDKGPQDVSEYVMASVEEVNSIPSDPIKGELLYQVINVHLNRLNKEDRDSLIVEWKALNSSKKRLKNVEDKLEVLASLAKGNPAPGFKYVNLEGDSMTMADFKGKVVYIDVWATWCAPCIAEHPHMEELQKQYENENVAFIAISVDSSPEPWKKMVKKKELGGIHLYAEGAWGATIMQKYAISGIPRFILIDQEGNIADANAARPSGDIAEDIDDLLSKGVQL
ncbi:TlpA disulfide reductase family protein [Marivirga salinae]|uniref:TlpA disulfide reductase family protein n=1 Tax=Marivirga salinarum TaxID=3059078 RepID=A0AA51RAP3_9BACT|nr:TlpA disulfide reductase family protein [Marivirga sp. BDSF4-3]WMN11326.1 TlpA disulfide reductase family protein [Marivirga sp. BDSF4-3]